MNSVVQNVKKLSLIIFMCSALVGFSQTKKNIDLSNSDILIEGTSNIHDWVIDVNKFEGTIHFDAKGQKITSINDLTLKVWVESFDSGKSKMDNNTYEALKLKKHPSIDFVFTNTKSLKSNGSDEFSAVIKGELTIAGKTQSVEIPLEILMNNNKFNIKTSKSINMTDYDVEPPTALFGTITTGEEVKIKFNLTYL
ncbi:YceI family protein [Psychroflexus aestuariivivens]|uniref:YceI family protein n=1 Tax=Psychroflexus aestuariivivens TaxID=1795040 RepID=UPI000FD7C278|nr:YceI family protein [Psychroflexus aestuariivivens]